MKFWKPILVCGIAASWLGAIALGYVLGTLGWLLRRAGAWLMTAALVSTERMRTLATWADRL